MKKFACVLLALFLLSGLNSEAMNGLAKEHLGKATSKTGSIKNAFVQIECQVGFALCGHPVCLNVYGDTWRELNNNIGFYRFLFSFMEHDEGCPAAYNGYSTGSGWPNAN